MDVSKLALLNARKKGARTVAEMGLQGEVASRKSGRAGASQDFDPSIRAARLPVLSKT